MGAKKKTKKNEDGIQVPEVITTRLWLDFIVDAMFADECGTGEADADRGEKPVFVNKDDQMWRVVGGEAVQGWEEDKVVALGELLLSFLLTAADPIASTRKGSGPALRAAFDEAHNALQNNGQFALRDDQMASLRYGIPVTDGQRERVKMPNRMPMEDTGSAPVDSGSLFAKLKAEAAAKAKAMVLPAATPFELPAAAAVPPSGRGAGGKGKAAAGHAETVVGSAPPTATPAPSAAGISVE